jgi:hypothetical protein
MSTADAVLTVTHGLRMSGDAEVADKVLAASAARDETRSRAMNAGSAELIELERDLWRRLEALVARAEAADNELRPIARALRDRHFAEGRVAELRAERLGAGLAELCALYRDQAAHLRAEADEEAKVGIVGEETVRGMRELADSLERAAKSSSDDDSGTRLGASMRRLHIENAESQFRVIDVGWLRRRARKARRETRVLRKVPVLISIVIGLGIFTLGAEVLLDPLGLGLVLPIIGALWAIERWQVDPRVEMALLPRRRREITREANDLLALEIQVLLGFGLARLNALHALNPTPESTAALQYMQSHSPT